MLDIEKINEDMLRQAKVIYVILQTASMLILGLEMTQRFIPSHKPKELRRILLVKELKLVRLL